MEEGEDKLTQAELDELTALLSAWWSPELITFDQQLEWAESQDIQILKIERHPTLNNYIVTIHYKYSNPPQTNEDPLTQAKDLFLLW
jgi:hypothetical protein